METAVTVLAGVGLAAAAAALAAGRRALAPTSLSAAWGWAVGAVTAWLAVWVMTSLTRVLTGGWADLAWYAVAVLGLCPPLAVLGARRPGSGAWTWFVVLPLAIVLNLPAVTAAVLSAGGPREAFEAFRVETPWFLGFVLVLVMGVGNYVGTRWTLPALAGAAALLLLVAPLTDVFAARFPPPPVPRNWASVCLGIAAGLALVAARSRPAADSGVERLWRDFRDLYGVVWARRVMDRTNEALAARKLPVRLEWTSLTWSGQPDRRTDAAFHEARRQAADTLRWLLKRFVEAAWIESRLSGGPGTDGPEDDGSRRRPRSRL